MQYFPSYRLIFCSVKTEKDSVRKFQTNEEKRFRARKSVFLVAQGNSNQS